VADVVAAGDVRQRFIAGVTARDGFLALVRRQLARTTEQYTMGPRALAENFSRPAVEPPG